MADPRHNKRRRLVLLALIIALPLIPAVIVQVLVRRSPPGKSITSVMSEVIAAMQTIPRPREGAEEFRLETRLDVGALFEIEVDRRIKVGSAAPLVEIRHYRLDVLTCFGDSSQVSLVCTEPKGATVLGADHLRLRWDRDGFLEIQEPTVVLGLGVIDARDALLKHHGIVLPGPFPDAAIENDWLAPPGTMATLEGNDILATAGLRIGREEMPHRGGSMPLALVGAVRPFRLLGYRRYAVELRAENVVRDDDSRRDEKVGVYESVVRGRIETPENGLAPSQAEVRIRESLSFRAPAATFDDEILCTIRQRIRRIPGGPPR